MKESNKKKLQELKVLGYIVSIFSVIWIWIKDFIDLPVHYETVVLVLGVSLVYASSQIALILRSEEGKEISINQHREKPIGIWILWGYLILLGILFVGIIPPQMRHLSQILNNNSSIPVIAIVGTIIPVLGALGIFVGGMFTVTLRNWSRRLVIGACLGINFEIMYMMITGCAAAKGLYLFLGFVFMLCVFPVFFLLRPKIKDQFMQNIKHAKD